MIRVVIQMTPFLFILETAVDEKEIGTTFTHQGTTYYLAQRKEHFVLYKPAISGYGESKQTFDPRQR